MGQITALAFIIYLWIIACTVYTQEHDHSEYHSKEIDDNSISSSRIRGHAQDDKKENHKPIFIDCENYKPVVQEAQQRGTPVIQVHAKDDDDKNQMGGRVTYRIVSRDGEPALFTINNVTGEIYTNSVFDRDEPGRQKELYLTIQATDDGKPPLADICTFKVTITDINDNAPSFDQLDYKVEVSEDLKINQEVMRALAYDFDEGDNAKLTYSIITDNAEFNSLFQMNPNTGVLYLKQFLKGQQGKNYIATIQVQDNGEEPRSATAELIIKVVGSDKRAPTLYVVGKSQISLDENYADFGKALVNVTAESNIDDKSVQFEIIRGKTPETNRENTFTLNPFGNNTGASLLLVRPLDYEKTTSYTLTIRASNKDFLASSIDINVIVNDVNDEIPTFLDLLRGSVVENDIVGAQAMQVRAIDKDGTSPNRDVKYELLTPRELFEINENTGVITAKKSFDRETKSLYHVTIRAYDGAPSAIFGDKDQPNSANQTFQISIEDRNDNHPQFTKTVYVVHSISENSDLSKDVIEVKAIDLDGASIIVYSIIDGNIDEAFSIEETTGRIKVNKKLDFEKIESYNLTIRAFDGIFNDTATVIIHIQNENDEPPVFEPYNKTIEIEEESVRPGCIIILKAYDPDIKDRNADQKIVYLVGKEHTWFLDVEQNGCVKLISPLDRDGPNGSKQYQGFIYASDNDAGSNSLSTTAELQINLTDINDNAPILNNTEVVWYENEPPGIIATLDAIDYDSPENGPPFTFELASPELNTQFSVIGDQLHANTVFDREQQKTYIVPINITDSGSPRLWGISNLTVIIGDRNDNPAADGSSEIFVYKYQDLDTDIKIGRVYVTDPDDWDLPDKVFQSENGLEDNFFLDTEDKGMIVMRRDAIPGVYHLKFLVTEMHLPTIEQHSVHANVTVTIKDITEEAVKKSGSLRIEGTSIEQFVEKLDYSLSKKDLLQQKIAKILNTSIANVDVFTVLPSESHPDLVDVRFSAHGSPYYPPEKLNNKATEQQENLERDLDVKIVMISINECLDPSPCPRLSSCTNTLNIKREPAVVFTNKTSFVGVKAVTEAECVCVHRQTSDCLNGGTLTDKGCLCPEGFEGPNCEILGIGFNGDGWAMYPTFDACNETDILLWIMPKSDNGIIFYVGPLSPRQAQLSKDFMSLELQNGDIVLKVDLGTDSKEIRWRHKKLNDGAAHKIKISMRSNDVQIDVDDSPSQNLVWESFQVGGILNVNGPLQVGGRHSRLFPPEDTDLIWSAIRPSSRGFMGCITNFTYNSHVYNLGAPSDSHMAHINCDYGVMQAVSFGIDSNFLVAILVCIAILFILLLAVVVHKKKHDSLNEKDMDDTRENIINYEDEGGGECDTHFDLSVFPSNLDEKPPIRDNLYKQGAEVPADISGFLDNKKSACDNDPDNLPYDDVRHYGYEGDGNTSGSLSSLASCTDEGDLKFNYLSSFGPRFRKLADMYGDDASEEGSQNGGEESWC